MARDHSKGLVPGTGTVQSPLELILRGADRGPIVLDRNQIRQQRSMLIRKLLIPLVLVLFGLLTPELGQAQTVPDLRHQDGVDVMVAQRAGFGAILTELASMVRLAEKAAEPTSTPALRQVLDVRFQAHVSEIQLTALTQTHGYMVLNAVSWVSVQESPGSSQSVTVHGLDVTPAGLIINTLEIQTVSSAWSALSQIVGARWRVMSGLQRNCLDLGSLGVDAGCGSIDPVCRGGVNSTGWEGRLLGFGSLVIGQTDQLTLESSRCPSGVSGWFIMGQNATLVPFGNGNLCIDRSAGGLYRLGTVTTSGYWGEAELPLSNVSPALQALIQPGSNWYFQFLFNDVAGVGMNSTHALRVVFEP